MMRTPTIYDSIIILFIRVLYKFFCTAITQLYYPPVAGDRKPVGVIKTLKFKKRDFRVFYFIVL